MNFRVWLESPERMIRVDVFLDEMESDPYETFFASDEEEVERRLDGYRKMFEPAARVLHRASWEDGNAEAHDLFGI